MDEDRPVTMTSHLSAGQVVIAVTAKAGWGGPIAYTLSVTGGSTTRHAGRTVLGPRGQQLSRVAVPVDGPWHATLEVRCCGTQYALHLGSGQPR